MKTDGEPAIVAVRDALLKYNGGIGIPEQPEKGEKAENGYIEEAGKTVRELACAFITQAEEGVDDKLPLDCDLMPWIIRRAAMCHSRYAVGKDGRTAFERMRGRRCKSVVVPIG